MDLQTSKATAVLYLEKFWSILSCFWKSVLFVRKAISYHSAKSKTMTKTKTREKEVFTNIVILFHHKNYPLTQNFWQKDFGHSFEKYILCMVNLTQTPPQTLPRYPPDISPKGFGHSFQKICTSYAPNSALYCWEHTKYTALSKVRGNPERGREEGDEEEEGLGLQYSSIF